MLIFFILLNKCVICKYEDIFKIKGKLYYLILFMLNIIYFVTLNYIIFVLLYLFKCFKK